MAINSNFSTMVRVTIQQNEIKVKTMRRSLSSGGGGVEMKDVKVNGDSLTLILTI